MHNSAYLKRTLKKFEGNCSQMLLADRVAGVPFASFKLAPNLQITLLMQKQKLLTIHFLWPRGETLSINFAIGRSSFLTVLIQGALKRTMVQFLQPQTRKWRHSTRFHGSVNGYCLKLKFMNYRSHCDIQGGTCFRIAAWHSLALVKWRHLIDQF